MATITKPRPLQLSAAGPSADSNTRAEPASPAAAAAARALSRPISPAAQPPKARSTDRPSVGSRSSLFKRRSYLADDDPRRDSALAPSVSTAIDESSSRDATPAKPNNPATIPSIVVHRDSETTGEQTRSAASPAKGLTSGPRPAKQEPAAAMFPGITTVIPSGDLEDPFSSANLEFSKRGSVLWGGERALGRYGALAQPGHGRTMSKEEHRLSRRLRAMYEHGDEAAADWDDDKDTIGGDADAAQLQREQARATALSALDQPRIDPAEQLRSASALSSSRQSFIRKEPSERAGGMEDWDGVHGAEIDRYGFISAKSPGSRASSGSARLASWGGGQGSRRAPNTLQIVEENPSSPRDGDRPVSATPSNRASLLPNDDTNRLSKRSLRPSPSLMSNRSRRSNASTFSRFRGSKHGPSWMHNASDMLAPYGFETPQSREEEEKAAVLERKREAKWAKMARVVNKSPRGGGTGFTFDTTDPKLQSRTWKGIPNRWRPTAWYAFLAASARQRKDAPSEADLVAAFHALQEQNCADDVQIDMDVPRTISSHILFRRRYRGGQRALFRTLHAIALYFPATGYVQGMAPLAATLLCYYDEARAFVMLARLWHLRGLAPLYQEGFAGLMAALADLDARWLARRPVAAHLAALGVAPTAYGTKWYLTLFNYSVPFAAQLRVWDVLMLLGGGGGADAGGAPNLDVLHAVAAALIDGLEEILLDSDFEGAMKVLTAPVAVARPDKLLEIARHEWKLHRRP